MATVENLNVYENPMKRVRIAKAVINISVGKSGEPLQRAMRVLEDITEHKPCQRKAKQSIRNFGISRKEPISCIVTLRGLDAITFLKRALEAVNNRISHSSFDRQGNFAFGIREHIDIPGTTYIPELGIVGMDVCVSLEKPGYRVKRRRIKRSNINHRHVVTPEEGRSFVKNFLGVELVGAE
jgi:large subunit ribosomal protein L5